MKRMPDRPTTLRSSTGLAAGLLLAGALTLGAQTSWFQPSLLERPEVRKALSIGGRARQRHRGGMDQAGRNPVALHQGTGTREVHPRRNGETAPERDQDRRYLQRQRH